MKELLIKGNNSSSQVNLGIIQIKNYKNNLKAF